MKNILKILKWIIPCQIVGIICSFIAYFLPYAYDNPIKSGLFVFGMALIFGYWYYLLVNVYLPLKKKETDK